MNCYTINGLTRISKALARKLWAADATPVYACPCKLRPGPPWYPEVQLPTDSGATFDRLATATEFYNCGPATGHRLNFYVAKGVLPL